jgi:transcriptional regulator with XRE-family HTH domain
MERVADRLREARRNAGFATPEDFAARVGVDPAIYRGYEEGTRYMSPQLGYRVAQLLNIGWIDLLYGPEYTDELADYGWQGTTVRRRPRIAMAEMAYAGGGVGAVGLAARPRQAPEPALFDRRLDEPPPAPPIAPAIGRDTVTVEELDTNLAAGAGIARASLHPLAQWTLPRDAIKLGSRAAGGNLKILAVLGDDMEPSLRLNDRILVDTADTRPSPAGIFVVWDGMSLVLRRIDIVMGSEPVMLRIGADNPQYQPVERRLAETLIQGRVIARWSWV